MQDDKHEKSENKLSYEILNAKCQEQDKEIAALHDEINDLKEIIKANFTSAPKKQGDGEDEKKTNKEEFEKRLKEGLGLC